MEWSPQKLRDFFTHFDASNPNHLAASDLLQKHASYIMNDGADWVKTFRSTVEPSTYLPIAASIIAVFEGFSAKPYKCPAGVWTIGYGSTYYPDGSLVQSGDAPITRDQALSYLQNTVDKAIVPTLSTKIPTWGLMNNNQKAAIISFAYNLGTNFYGSEDFRSITKALSTKENWEYVPKALLLYVNPGSPFEAGLTRRRQAEGELWNGRGQFAR